MIAPKIPENENSRLKALKEYSILDTLPEKEYDEITHLAAQITGMPISLISLIDEKRQWFKSHYGVEETESPREVAFCAHAINDQNHIMIVPDSRKDERFHDNPMVTGDAKVIFYAGVPLVTSDGFSLGTLCVIDNKPNELSENQLKALSTLANQLMQLFELRKKTSDLNTRLFELEAQNKGLKEFAHIAAHDIKSPLGNITALTNMLKDDYGEKMDSSGVELIDLIHSSSEKLTGLIDGILQYSKNTHLLSQSKEEINFHKTMNEVIKLVGASKQTELNIDAQEHLTVFTSKIALEQVLINLIANSIKYNDKEKVIIFVHAEEDDEFLKVNIADNGPGIKEEDKEKIFKIFETTSNTDKAGSKGTGIGLATVKSLVEGLGGKINVDSKPGQGAEFTFTIRK